MQLTRFTDYSLRVLLYLAADPDRNPPATVDEISTQFRISRNHLVKIVHTLGQKGYLITTRGRGGGIRLAKPASELRMGALVKDIEEMTFLVDCSPSSCIITGHCSLTGVLAAATRHFFEELDQYTLADALDHQTKSAVQNIFPVFIRERKV